MNEFCLTNENTVIKIADEAPRAMSAYFLCLTDSNESGYACFTKDYIQNTIARSWTKFKNDIRDLASIMLVRFWVIDDEIRVELVQQVWE
jgi:hypothetical protein